MKGLIGSVFLHAVLVLVLLIAQSCAPKHGPLIDPDAVMEVSLAPPLQTSRMVQKETRAPEPKKGVEEPVPQPKEEVIKTDSEMVAPEAQPEQGDERSTEDALREMKRKALLDALRDAPEGAQDRQATSEDGVEGSTGSNRGVGDPRLAAYYERVKKAVLPNFRPIQDDPALAVKVLVTVDREGTILGYKVGDSSGDVSFDQAAVRAVKATDKVPAPPEDLMPGDTATLTMVLTPKDAQ